MKINPINKANEPFIFLPKNIIVSVNPTNMKSPQTNSKFPNIKNALSKNINNPNPYIVADIPTIIVPSSIY